MSKKKNIDRLFQEGFKDFEAHPTSMSWDVIEKRLDQKKKGRVIPIWWTLGGAAAALVILFTSLYLGGYTQLNNSEEVIVTSEKEMDTESNFTDSLKENDPIKNIENQLIDEVVNNDTQLATEGSKIDKESLIKSTQDSKVNTRANVPLKKNNLITSGDESSDANLIVKGKVRKIDEANPIKNKSVDNGIALKNNPGPLLVKDKLSLLNEGKKVKASSKDGIVIQNNPVEKGVLKNNLNTLDKSINDSLMDSAIEAVDSTKKKLPTLEDIAAQEKITDSLEENKFKGRWAATTQVGPVYSNSLSGSALNNDVIENNRDAGYNLSYGIGLSYEISPRLSVRTGVNQVNMTYSTQDINYQVNVNLAARGQAITQAYNSDAVGNAAPSNNNSPISNDSFGTGFAADEFSNNEFKGIKGELSQQLGYIEVPVELQYNIFNSKLKISVLGGMSALFLTDNVVSVQNPNERLELGEDSNFNQFNQSANFGLGFGYDFTNQLGAFIEPSFKYQLNTLRNNTANFRPYTIGIQSGVIYRF